MSHAVIMWIELFPDEKRKPAPASACRAKSCGRDGKRDRRWDCRDPCWGWGWQTLYLLLGVVSVGSPGGLGTHHVVQVTLECGPPTQGSQGYRLGPPCLTRLS